MKLNSNHKLLLAIFTAAIPATMWARTRTDAEMAASANSVLRQSLNAPGRPGATEEKVSLQERKEATAIYTLGNTGFAIVSTDDLLPEVLGYSDTSWEGSQNNENLQWWLRTVEECGRENIRLGISKTTIAPYGDYAPSMDAMCTSQWDQDSPYNCLCPTGTSSGDSWQGYYGTGTCVTGCVATAMAQVLYYHKSPVSGIGTHSVMVRQQDGSNKEFVADYENANYDWDNMLDTYANGYTDVEAKAVGLLMYHCGVATDMSYATDGSGAYMENCRDGLIRNFGLEQTALLDRDAFTEAEWMEYVYEEINNDRPIIYAGDDMAHWVGHCFVLDGYDTSGRVHINWGWGGSGDGCFDIATLSTSGYSFSKYQQMVIGVDGIDGAGAHAGKYNINIELTEAGTLMNEIESLEIPLEEIVSLYVQGTIEESDLAYIRKIGQLNKLATLDLHKAQFESLPDSAFAHCERLNVIRLPRSATQFGKNVFVGCTRLSELRLYHRDVPKAGKKMFEGLNLSRIRLNVPAGCSTRYQRSLQWKDFPTISEFGTAVMVRNCTRKVGEANPRFTYTIEGDPLKGGEPVMTCEATPDSPAGRYPIYISRGTINAPDADFVDGYLVVTENTSAIEEVSADAAAQQPAYDLRGQHVSGNAQGVTLYKGRKVVIR